MVVLWCTFHAKSDVRKACEKTLSDLKLDYLDVSSALAMGFKPQAIVLFSVTVWWGGLPLDSTGETISDDTHFLETWEGMERAGGCRLGQSYRHLQFQQDRLKLFSTSQASNTSCQQPGSLKDVESHPYLTQEKLIDYCHSKGISVTAYSPLGSPDRPGLNQTTITSGGSQHKGHCRKIQQDTCAVNMFTLFLLPCQVLIRFHIQRNVIVIPKSITPHRIQENFQVFDFQLSDEEMKTILGFNRNWRVCPMQWLVFEAWLVEYSFNLIFVEVGDADGLHQASIHQLFHHLNHN
ncbi:hypothetical protein INR49_026640, partial [Caranx melampygus]